MPRIKYIGKDIWYYGKTLWEIVGNLKDYGVGRLITRGIYNRYSEPSFMKILKVTPKVHDEVLSENNSGLRKTYVWVEQVFRGQPAPEVIEIFSTSYKADFRLIPKDEEEIWWKRFKESPDRRRILPEYGPLPPLLNYVLCEERKKRGEQINGDMKMKYVYQQKTSNIARVAKEGETPDFELSNDFGTKLAPRLFENLDVMRDYYLNQAKKW